MFGIGMPEMILILAIALIVIGPKKLPDLAKSLGRAMREFKKATNEFKDTLQIDGEMEEVKKAFSDIKDDVTSAVDIIPAESDNETEKTGRDEQDQDLIQEEDEQNSDQTKDDMGSEQAETEGSENLDNLKKLNKAFAEMNADSESSQEDETVTDDDSEKISDDDQKDTKDVR
jgi:TatA/E family protein of Tat protein translocase